jgi:hypothetical protein
MSEVGSNFRIFRLAPKADSALPPETRHSAAAVPIDDDCYREAAKAHSVASKIGDRGRKVGARK